MKHRRVEPKLTFKQRYDVAVPSIIASDLTGVGAYVATSSYGPALRKAEVVGPFFEHAGNMIWSTPLAMAAFGAAVAGEKLTSNMTRAQRIVVTGLAGLAIGFAANAVSDTETGYNMTHTYASDSPENHSPFRTVDYGDLASGTLLTAALAAGAAARRDSLLQVSARDQDVASGSPGFNS